MPRVALLLVLAACAAFSALSACTPAAEQEAQRSAAQWEEEALAEQGLAEDEPAGPPPLQLENAPAEGPMVRMRRLIAPVDAPLFDPLVTNLGVDAPLQRTVSLSAEDCYSALVVAADPGAGVGIALESPDGSTRIAGGIRRGWALLPWVCPDASGAWQLTLTSDGRNVDAEYGVFRVADTRAREVTPRLDALIAAWAPESYPLAPPQRESLSEGDVRATPLLLEEGSCYALLATSFDGLRDVDSRLFDTAGLRIRQDISTNPEPVIERYCPPLTGLYRYELDAYRGDGDVYWQVRVWEGDTP